MSKAKRRRAYELKVKRRRANKLRLKRQRARALRAERKRASQQVPVVAKTLDSKSEPLAKLPIVSKPLVPEPGSERSSLARLPLDILTIIVDFLEAANTETLRNLSLASPLLYSLVKTNRVRHVIFDLTPRGRRGADQRCTYIESEGLLSAVRQVTVLDKLPFEQKKPDAHRLNRLKTICDLLPRMPGLKRVTYQSKCVPNEMLMALRALPHLKLCTRLRPALPPPSEPPDPGDYVGRFCGNANLHALDVQVSGLEADDCGRIMRQLKPVLLSCPNLRCLALEVIGESIFYERKYFGLGIEEGEKLPPLEQLTLMNYPFGQENRHHGSSFSTEGYPITGTEIDHWANNFDWSHLQKLHTSNRDFALALMPQLTGLKDFAFIASDFDQDISTFCSYVPAALRSISVPSLCHSGTLDGILRHASTLEELWIHRDDTFHAKWRETTVGLASLQRIQGNCRRISDLSVDITFSGEWPDDIFDVLASFPNLRQLEVCFVLGHKGHVGKSILTRVNAGQIFTYLHSQGQRHSGSSLRELVVRDSELLDTDIRGTDPDSDDESLLYPDMFPHGEPFPHGNTFFLCQLSEHPREAAAGRFVIYPPAGARSRLLQQGSEGPRGSCRHSLR